MKSFIILFLSTALLIFVGIYFISNSASKNSKNSSIQQNLSSTSTNKDALAYEQVAHNLVSNNYSQTNEQAQNVQMNNTMVQFQATNTMNQAQFPQKDTYTVILKTNQGDIVLELYTKFVPNTVDNFLKLSQSGFYNNVKFHRVIKGFMIQGGDPNTKDDNAKNTWGMGGPDYRFADEFVKGLSNVAGTISMANAGPNTNGSQFFINTNDNTFLDGKHSVFGKVVKGLDVVQKIENTKTDAADRPIDPVIILSVNVE